MYEINWLRIHKFALVSCNSASSVCCCWWHISWRVNNILRLPLLILQTIHSHLFVIVAFHTGASPSHADQRATSTGSCCDHVRCCARNECTVRHSRFACVRCIRLPYAASRCRGRVGVLVSTLLHMMCVDFETCAQWWKEFECVSRLFTSLSGVGGRTLNAWVVKIRPFSFWM